MRFLAGELGVIESKFEMTEMRFLEDELEAVESKFEEGRQ
jgi:hypothetical protein